MYDVIIIGGGAAGYGSAIYAARFGLKTLILTKEKKGLLKLTHVVENYPGFISLSGEELMQKLEDHVKSYNVPILEEEVTDIKKKNKGFEVKIKKEKYDTKTIIYATGTRIRKLNVPGEKEFTNKGVSYCALCDGPLFKNKILGVIGGSDSAAKEALLLTEYAKKVYVIYRGKMIHPEPINMERVKKNKKIEIINNTNIVEIKGDKFANKVILDKPYKGSKEFKLEGLFIEIGHIPQIDLAEKIGVKLNKRKEVIIDRMSRTNIEGFYAAGDVADLKFKQAITGVGEGVTAAYSAYEYINENFKK